METVATIQTRILYYSHELSPVVFDDSYWRDFYIPVNFPANLSFGEGAD